MSEDERMSEQAYQHAKDHGKEIAKKAVEEFPSDNNPVSIFMAGSPGAGKTETSIKLIELIGSNGSNGALGDLIGSGKVKDSDSILRIDADELRNHFAGVGYEGHNSHLFQRAASRLVDQIHDAALKKKINFLLDGTFSNEAKAEENIRRSLKRERYVNILYVYQTPQLAWQFVQEREIAEGRHIRKEDFAEKFCAPRRVADKMKAKFEKDVTLTLICKDIDNTNKFFKASIERIGDHIPEKYSEEEILEAVTLQE